MVNKGHLLSDFGVHHTILNCFLSQPPPLPLLITLPGFILYFPYYIFFHTFSPHRDILNLATKLLDNKALYQITRPYNKCTRFITGNQQQSYQITRPYNKMHQAPRW